MRYILAIGLVVVAYLTFDIVNLFNNWKFVESRCDRERDPSAPQCFFRESYVEARQLFISNAQKIGAQLHSLSVPLPSDNRYSKQDKMIDLTIDIAVLEGTSKEHLLLHISGTHGVEAHAGSAIQNAVLTDIAEAGSLDEYMQITGNQITNLTQSKPGQTPTIIFVHSYNPYGFHFGRRFNENNVDLNRNCLLSDAEWANVLGRQPNFANYETLSPLLNPPDVVPWYDKFTMLPSFLKTLFEYGYIYCMRAMVTGQYHTSKGLYYGGQKLEASHRLFHKWLNTQGYIDQFKHIVVIDVHTGLGKQGIDTLLLDTAMTVEEAREMFPGAPNVEGSGSSGGDTGYEAYRDTVGFQKQCFTSLWNKAQSVRVFTQEFGTVPGILVFYSLRVEHAAYQFGDDDQASDAAQLGRSAFYVRKQSWKENIVKRGRILFAQGAINAITPDVIQVETKTKNEQTKTETDQTNKNNPKKPAKKKQE